MARWQKGAVAIAGIGESAYYRHGKSPDPEFKLALQAILAACADAGIDPRTIDGFASYSDDRNDAVRLATALGIHALRWSSMQWGGGGGGTAGAVQQAAAAIRAGMARRVIVFRALAQGQFARFGLGGYGGAAGATVSGETAFSLPYGAISPAQRYALKAKRFMHDHGVRQDALRAIALASYHHAQANPRAVMYGRPLTAEAYDASRWIAEPFHLYDCCQENDGAAAVLLVSAEEARDLPTTPAYLLGVAAGSQRRYGATSHSGDDFASANFKTVAADLYDQAGVTPADIDVVQAYENFTGGVMMSLAEHGLFHPDETNAALTPENLTAGTGRLPLNTSGGHLAEAYIHGANLIVEATRQLRGTSPNQVAGAKVSMMIAGPMVAPVSSLILGTAACL